MYSMYFALNDGPFVFDLTSEAMKSLTACCVGAAPVKEGMVRTRARQENRLEYIMIYKV